MTTTPRWLNQAAKRGSERVWALGAVFDNYCRREGLTREQLSSLLGCTTELLAWLSLCRKPALDRFAADVSRIAERFQIEASKLARVVRSVDAIAVLGSAHDAQEENKLLLAARDRNEESNR